ncbi:MAG: AraC family transcriptional regulator [Halothermotrichaceae bacterium]
MLNKNIFKRTYFRLFLILTIIMVVVLLCFSYLLSFIFSEYAYSQINESNENNLEQIEDNLDFILTKLKSYSLKFYHDPDIQEWFYPEHANSWIYFLQAKNTVKNYMLMEEYIYNVYLINLNSRQVLERKTEIGLYNFDNFYDQEVLEKILNNPPSNLNYIAYKSGDKKHLALVLPATPSRTNNYGYMVVLLDNELLNDYILGNKSSSDIKVNITDNEEQLILGGSDNLLSTNNFSDNNIINLDNKKWHISKSYMETYGWHIYYMAHLENLEKNIYTFRRNIIIYTIIIVIILCLAIYLNSKRAYKPIATLASQIKKRYQNELKQDQLNYTEEYNLIKNTFDLLSEKINQMDSEIRDNRRLVNEYYLKQWLQQGQLTKSIREKLIEQTTILSFDYLRIAVIRIEAYAEFIEENDFSSRRLWKYAMENISKDLLNTAEREIRGIDFGSDHLALLIACNQDDEMDLIDKLNQVIDNIERIIGIKVTVAISNLKEQNNNVKHIYKQVYEISLLKFISGEDKIYKEKDFKEYHKLLKPLPDDSLVNELIVAVRLCEEKEVDTILEQFMEHFQELSHDQCHFHLTYLLYNIFKSFSKLSSVGDYEAIETQLGKFKTLKEVKEWLRGELLEIIDKLNQKENSSRKEKVSLEIIEYIRHNLTDPMLSIDDIADHVSLSSNYVRQIFKDVLNSSISAYILHERVEKVKELLLNTDMNVTDIGENAGFQSKSHYYATFKKEVGITPGQYRDKIKIR